MSTAIEITLNGNPHTSTATTIAQLVEQLQLSDKRIAVEYNGQLCPKHQHTACVLQPNDRIEIVQAVGGG